MAVQEGRHGVHVDAEARQVGGGREGAYLYVRVGVCACSVCVWGVGGWGESCFLGEGGGLTD